MKILVVNAGSSSLKYQLFDMETEDAIAKGNVERIGMDGANISYKVNGIETQKKEKIKTHTAALQMVLDMLTDKNGGVIADVSEIGAVGHRVLHGAEDYKDSILITDEVMKICEKNKALGPLHMPANIDCIKACKAVMPNTPMVAVFDTSFHQTMPNYAFMYAVGYDLYKEDRIRKYGFHGTSHKFVVGECEKYYGKTDLKIITCHLGNGASCSAVMNGKCIDTSMGLTPLEGLVMGTRSGDIDPAVMLTIASKLSKEKIAAGKSGNEVAVSVDEVVTYLNKRSGLYGIAGGSDCRDLCDWSVGKSLEKAQIKDEKEQIERAELALEMFAYRVKKYIGSYAAVMNGVDVIVLTGGIGENSAPVRKRILHGLDYLGVDFNDALNDNAERGKIFELTNHGSRTKIVIIPTNEELVIARDANRCVSEAK